MSLILLISILITTQASLAAADFYKEADITWGGQCAKILNGGRDLTLSLDQTSGSGFQSKNEYLFGRFDMQLKLVPGNSAGTVTTFYLSSQGAGHDEIDFEFLGNSSGNPYTIHTNVYAQGKGDKEQQFQLWFDPTSSFHTYSIVWNPQRIIFLVDNNPIRVFNNQEAIGVPFPKSQHMRVYASLWNADDWATQGGRVKTDWTKAPFTASYRNINIRGCPKSSSSSGTSCGSSTSTTSENNEGWRTQELDAAGRNRLRWVQSKHMVYNYCSDKQRFAKGVPAECKRSRAKVTNNNSSSNVYAQGKCDKEQQFQLWFDPTSSFHTYSIVWNPQRIIFLVDNNTIRVFNNQESVGVPFPKSQHMRVYATLWNADDWATQGGRVKTDWTKAPFTTSYRNFNIKGCAKSSSSSGTSCGSSTSTATDKNEAWRTQELDAAGRNRLRWVQSKHMVYNYCSDKQRFAKGVPAECKRSRFL